MLSKYFFVGKPDQTEQWRNFEGKFIWIDLRIFEVLKLEKIFGMMR